MTEDVHEDIAIVKEINNGEVVVEIEPSGACDSCSISGVCGGKDKKVIHRIKTDRRLELGQKVRIEISSGLRIVSSLMLFLFPIILMIIFYFIAKEIGINEDFSILISFAGLLLSGIVLKIVDKKLAKKFKAKIIEEL